MKRPHLLSVLAVVLLVVLAGCSGGVSDTTTSPNATPAGTAETTSPSTSSTSQSSPSGTETLQQSGPNGTLSIHFINVGQGSSTLVIGPENQTMLIDSGDWTDDGEDVLAYLDAHNIDRIDYLVTTHADADHIGGHAAVIDHFETQKNGIGAVYDPGIASSSQTYQRYLDEVEEHNVTLYETRAGDQIPFEGVDAQILAPPEGYIANEDRNENSIVVQLDFGQSNFLLPGDGETASEEYLLAEYGSQLNATVLSAGHHGSQSSSTSEFLDTVQPCLTVISSAYDSQYGHPDEAVLQRLSERSIQTYWTATHGNIQLTSNGSAITVATQREAPTEPLDLRNGSAVEPGTEDDVQVRTIIHLNGSATSTATPDGGTTTATASPTASATAAPTTPTVSSTPTATESTGGTDQSTPLSVAAIHADAEGTESENLNDEYIVFENTGDQTLDLSGWTVTDAADHTYTIPSGFTLDAGAQVTLHTGSGTDSSTDLYWGSGSPIWNNGGDTITARTDSGTIVLEEDY